MGNILKDKSMAFAIRIVNLHKYPDKKSLLSIRPDSKVRYSHRSSAKKSGMRQKQSRLYS